MDKLTPAPSQLAGSSNVPIYLFQCIGYKLDRLNESDIQHGEDVSSCIRLWEDPSSSSIPGRGRKEEASLGGTLVCRGSRKQTCGVAGKGLWSENLASLYAPSVYSTLNLMHTLKAWRGYIVHIMPINTSYAEIINTTSRTRSNETLVHRGWYDEP